MESKSVHNALLKTINAPYLAFHSRTLQNPSDIIHLFVFSGYSSPHCLKFKLTFRFEKMDQEKWMQHYGCLLYSFRSYFQAMRSAMRVQYVQHRRNNAFYCSRAEL